MQTMQQARGSAAERARSEAPPCAGRRGSILVEFALVSIAFYLILAGTLEVGRMITTAQIMQNAARTMARELALMPLPATMTFDEALRCTAVNQRIYDPGLLAVPIAEGVDSATATWPIVNRILLPLMVVSEVDGKRILHYPGALVESAVFGSTVVIPNVISRGADGVETIRWVQVVEEIRTVATDPSTGPFTMVSTGHELGLVALRVNCAYQASTMSAFQPVDPDDENPVNEAILANDGGVTIESGSLGPGGQLSSGPDSGTYSGQYGLGKLYALNKEVRPFRRLVSGQGIFRREVFSAGQSCP